MHAACSSVHQVYAALVPNRMHVLHCIAQKQLLHHHVSALSALHCRYLGKAAHTETVSNVLSALTSAKLLGMTGTPIGKTHGLEDAKTIAALLRLPLHTKV